MPHDSRDQLIDLARRWSGRTEIAAQKFIRWLGVASSKFNAWRARYGRVHEHNGWVRRDFWLEAWEKRAIVEFHDRYPLEGYRRLTFMMLDANGVAGSPASVWRLRHQAGRLSRWQSKPSGQGKGFQPPLAPHQHWHVDTSHVNLAGTFYYLARVLDSYSRYLVEGERRESMRAADVEIVLQRARKPFPEARPRIISDNGPLFIARDFKEFIRLWGMTPVRTSPFYPQSNGKIERGHQSLKGECLRPGVPLSLQDARRLVELYVDYYNRVRLHSAIGYVTPLAKLEGREPEIFAQRDRKLEEARRQRQLRRQRSLSTRLMLPVTPTGEAAPAGLNGSGRVKRKPALRGRNRAEG